MKKIFFPGVLLALLFIFSCSKDEFTEEDAVQAQMDLISHQDSIQQVRDSLEKIGGILQFSVSVVPVSGSADVVPNYKSADAVTAIDSAVVTVSQHGKVLTAIVDETGIAVFTDLRVGELNVSVRAEGYTSGNFVAFVVPDVGSWSADMQGSSSVPDPISGVLITENFYGVQRSAAVMIPVFDLTEGTSNISGVVTYETNLINEVPEAAAGVNVIARIDVEDADFTDKYFPNLGACNVCDYACHITDAAYSDLIASDITGTDGSYSVDIPSAAAGLPVVVEIDDVVADQDILLNTLYGVDAFGVQTVRTLFGTGSYGSPSVVPAVDAAYVTFSAPTGVVTQQPLDIAEAYAVIGESGVAAIIITDEGEGYTQPPKLVIGGDGTGAEAVAYVSEGKVTSVQITSAGKGYTWAEVIVESFVETDADASPIIEYGVTGIVLSDPGSGYKSTPDVVITSSSGSGAVAEAVMSGYLSNIEVENMGSGYVCPPHVQVERGTGVLATATPVMTVYNPLYGIVLSDAYMNDPANWFETVPDVVIERTSTGSGATAVVQLGSSGTIDEIILSNVGSGYDEAPSIIISGDGTGAVAWAEIDNVTGEITAINVEEGGNGYVAATTTVQISNPPAGGTAPVVDRVVVLRPITGITLTNPGSGYDIDYTGNFTPADDGYDAEPDVVLDGTTLGEMDVTVLPDMSVETISVGTAGTEYDYLNPPAIIITPKCGYGSGATAVAEVLMEVASVIVTSAGSGYVDIADIELVIVTPPEGCDEQATAAVTGLGAGVLTDVTLDEAGLGYLGAPSVILYDVNDDFVAVLGATVSDGSLTGVTFGTVEDLTMSLAPYYIEITTFESAADFTNVAYPQSGKISFVQIDNPGAGYASAPMVRFIRVDGGGDPVQSGGFVDAQATAVIADGRVVEINITNPGTGYYYDPIIEIYVPDYLEVAKGVANFNADGYVESITVTNAGMGYATAPTVTISAAVPGMGTGATAVAVVEDGMIDDVVMTNNGSGYLGKNTPGAARGVSIKGTNSTTTFKVYAGKSYITDIYLGTGVRNEDYEN